MTAVWEILALVFFVPVAYLFLSLPNPEMEGVFRLAPQIGSISLAAGIILGILKRRSDLFLFLIPFAVNVIMLVTSYLMGDVFRNDDQAIIAFVLFFVGIEMIIAGYLVYRSRGARIAAAMLFMFFLGYAELASYVAGANLGGVGL